MKTIVHVNQQVIVRNRRECTNDPPLIVRNYKGVRHAHAVGILGPSRVINSPHKPLKCGARVWIETTADVVTSDARKICRAFDAAEERESTEIGI